MADPNDDLIRSWQRSLHERSPGTRDLYLHGVRLFERWLAESDRTTDLLAVRRGDVEAWFYDQADAGLSKATRWTRWTALRSFYQWATDEDEIDANPMAKVKVARPDVTPAPVLDDDAVKAMLKACQGRGFLERRDTAALRTFLATGARLAEVTNLLVDDVDLDARLVVITRGKGGRRRVVRIDGATAAAIDRYRRVRGRRPGADRPELWLAIKGPPLTTRGMSTTLERRAREAGVEGFHVHLLRHWWAHRWQEKGGNEGSLQVLGGWQDASVMARYGAARKVDRALRHYDEIDLLGDL